MRAIGIELTKNATMFWFSSILMSCTSLQNPAIPGLDQETNLLGELAPEEVIVKETLILEAMKCQMTRGFNRVDELKREMVDTVQDEKLKQATENHLNAFNFQNGSGTLAGKMQSVTSNGLTFNVVFPFGGFDRNDPDATAPGAGTPSIGQSASNTSVQEVKRTFDINPNYNIDDLELCNRLAAERVDVGRFITDSIVSAFTSFASVRSKGIEPLSDEEGNLIDFEGNLLEQGANPLYRVVPYNPGLTSTFSETTTSFTVIRKPEGGLELKVVPTAPRLDSGTIAASLSGEDTSVYTLTTKLPTKIGQSSDTRRLHYCLDHSRGGYSCIEEPFDTDRLNFYQDGLDQDFYRFEVNTEGNVVITTGPSTRALANQRSTVEDTRNNLAIFQAEVSELLATESPNSDSFNLTNNFTISSLEPLEVEIRENADDPDELLQVLQELRDIQQRLVDEEAILFDMQEQRNVIQFDQGRGF